MNPSEYVPPRPFILGWKQFQFVKYCVVLKYQKFSKSQKLFDSIISF
jgi:hypothetical protein